jgi:hypothetical protein
MTFSNTGTVSITGTAFIEIWREGGAAAGGFQHKISNLPPGEHVVFEDEWDSAGEPGGDYTLLGYVTYDSQSTLVETAHVSTLERVYLPMVMRSG